LQYDDEASKSSAGGFDLRMKWLLAALGFLMVAAGGYWAFTGSLIVQVERGWSSVIAGSVVFSTGFLILALGALMGSVERLAAQMRDAQRAGPRPIPATPQHSAPGSAVHSPLTKDISTEPEDKSQLRLELASSPPQKPIQPTYKPSAPLPLADEAKLPIPEPTTAPNVEEVASSTRLGESSAPAQLVEESAAPIPTPQAQEASAQPAAAPTKSAKPVQNPLVRPVMPRPAPPSPMGRPVPPPPPTARVRPIHPALAPPPPPPPTSAPQVAAEVQPLAAQPEASSEAPVPASRATREPRKVGWLERALEGASPDSPAFPKPVASSPPSPAQRAPSAKDAPMEIAAHEADDDKPAAAPSPVRATDARTRGAPNMVETDDVAAPVAAPRSDEPVVALRAAPDVNQPPEPVRLPATRPDELELAPPARRIPEPPPVADLPKIMRKYESQGVNYTLYEDGSIDADSNSGRFRFASLDELRTFLEQKN
jgi:hypothetical protein